MSFLSQGKIPLTIVLLLALIAEIFSQNALRTEQPCHGYTSKEEHHRNKPQTIPNDLFAASKRNFGTFAKGLFSPSKRESTPTHGNMNKHNDLKLKTDELLQEAVNFSEDQPRHFMHESMYKKLVCELSHDAGNQLALDFCKTETTNSLGSKWQHESSPANDSNLLKLSTTEKIAPHSQESGTKARSLTSCVARVPAVSSHVLARTGPPTAGTGKEIQDKEAPKCLWSRFQHENSFQESFAYEDGRSSNTRSRSSQGQREDNQAIQVGTTCGEVKVSFPASQNMGANPQRMASKDDTRKFLHTHVTVAAPSAHEEPQDVESCKNHFYSVKMQEAKLSLAGFVSSWQAPYPEILLIISASEHNRCNAHIENVLLANKPDGTERYFKEQTATETAEQFSFVSQKIVLKKGNNKFNQPKNDETAANLKTGPDQPGLQGAKQQHQQGCGKDCLKEEDVNSSESTAPSYQSCNPKTTKKYDTTVSEIRDEGTPSSSPRSYTSEESPSASLHKEATEEGQDYKNQLKTQPGASSGVKIQLDQDSQAARDKGSSPEGSGAQGANRDAAAPQDVTTGVIKQKVQEIQDS